MQLQHHDSISLTFLNAAQHMLQESRKCMTCSSCSGALQMNPQFFTSWSAPEQNYPIYRVFWINEYNRCLFRRPATDGRWGMHYCNCSRSTSDRWIRFRCMAFSIISSQHFFPLYHKRANFQAFKRSVQAAQSEFITLEKVVRPGKPTCLISSSQFISFPFY